MKPKGKIPTIFGVLFLVLGLAGGVVLVNREAIFKLGASPQKTPKDIRVTNVTNTSFTVSWITDGQSEGLVKWGETSSALNRTANEVADAGPKLTHAVTVNGLTAGKTYYFLINSGGIDINNEGVPWSVSTESSAAATTSRISGTVALSTGVPANDALIYVTAPGMSEQSTAVSSGGNWVMTIPLADQSTVLDVYVQGAGQGIATALVHLSGATPLPAITLGRTYDLRTTDNTVDNTVSDSEITLPEQTDDEESSAAAQSRFELSQKATAAPVTTVTVTSIDENEKIFTGEPEFFGRGPANTTFTIVVNSETKVTGNVTVNADGTWEWPIPQGLEDGAHTMTITWRDARGILQTLTRNFVVEANAQEPSFESTPSAQTTTPKPTVVATATPTASTSATPRATASATVKPTIAPTKTPTATGSALPNAGVSLGTVSVLALGLSFISGGVFLALATNQKKF